MLKVAPKNCEAKLFELEKDICKWSDWVGRTSRSTCSTVDIGCLGCISAIVSVREGVQEELLDCYIYWTEQEWTLLLLFNRYVGIIGYGLDIFVPCYGHGFSGWNVCISKFLDQEFANWVVRYSLVLEKAGVFCHGLQHLALLVDTQLLTQESPGCSVICAYCQVEKML